MSINFVRINCRQNDQGLWCKDKRVKRSLLGIGARCCLVAEGRECPFQDKYERPCPPPPPPKTTKPAEAGSEGQGET